MDSLVLDENGKVYLPDPAAVPRREKEDAMGAYLMMFGTWAIGLPLPIFSIIAAAVYHGINKNKSRFVAFHSFQSMITEIVISTLNSVFIVYLILEFIGGAKFGPFFWAFLIFAGIWNLLYLVYSIVGAVRAYHGRLFYFPFFGRFCYDIYYGARALEREKHRVMAESHKNEPPRGY